MTVAPFILRNINSIQRASLIAQAHNRLLIYAPGLSAAEMDALKQVRSNLVPENILVYLDVSENSFLSGYWHGQLAGVLASLIDKTHVHNTFQARLGLLVVDDRSLIFTPPLPRVEAEPDNQEANAVQLNAEMTELLWRSILIRAHDLLEEGSMLAGANGHKPDEPIQIPERPPVDQGVLEQITARQEHLPPIQPNQERLLVSLQNQLKLVRFHVIGYKLENRTLSLPNEIVEILGSDSGEVNEYLRASWRIITEQDDKEMQNLQSRMRDQVDDIRIKYLKPLGHFGGGLLTKQRPQFEHTLQALEATLDQIRTYIREKLPAYLDKSRQQLVLLILERTKARNILLPEPPLDLFTSRSSQDLQRRAVERLVDKVNWPTLEELVSGVELNYAIDDMTNDHLSQPSFIKLVEKAYGIDLARLLDEVRNASGAA